MTDHGIWRTPAVESHDYPGLCVHDGRVTGSITAGCSRLPLWAFLPDVVREGWEAVAPDYDADDHIDVAKVAAFVYNLLEARGEFGRLLCVLADVERRERTAADDRPWWDHDDLRRRVADQLRCCLDVVEGR